MNNEVQAVPVAGRSTAAAPRRRGRGVRNAGL